MTRLADIQARQGIPEPATPAEKKVYERMRVERRKKNIENAREVLAKNHVKYHEHDTEFSIYFVVDGPLGVIKYYPDTGRWWEVTRRKAEYHFGVRNLVKHVTGDFKK